MKTANKLTEFIKKKNILSPGNGALLLGSFLVCPCPLHATLIGASLVGVKTLIEATKK